MMNPIDAWEISEESFPNGAPAGEVIEFLLHYAILAPSSHNTQPWHFRFAGNGVELLADRTRGLPVVDPDDRELIISCGGALGNLRVAAEYYGFSLDIDVTLDPSERDLLARVTLAGAAETTEETRLMFGAIVKRRTNRLPFRNEPLSEELLTILQSMAFQEGVWLEFVTDETARYTLADLISRADRMQWADTRFRRELAQWVHPNRQRSRDGMEGGALGFGNMTSKAAPFLIRTFDLGGGRAARDREIALHAPALAVLGSDGDTVGDWLATGRALANVLLRARAEDVWASFLNQPIEIAEFRRPIAEVIGRNGNPQIILRLGYGSDVQPSARREMRDVLLPPRHTVRVTHPPPPRM